MMPFLNIGGLALPLAPVTLLVGVWLGLTMVERFAHLYQVDGDKLYNLVFYGMIGGLVGARLWFALSHPQAFIDTPLNLFSTNPGLFDLGAGFLLALLTALVLGQRWKMPLLASLDGLTGGLAVFMLAIPLAQFASGQAFGAPSDLPWALELWGAARHPVQLYQAAAAALILWLCWPTRQKSNGLPGILFFRFVGYSAGTRLFLEAFHGDSTVIFGSIRAEQVIAWLVLAVALSAILRLNTKSHEV